jgi:hypothetical protein
MRSTMRLMFASMFEGDTLDSCSDCAMPTLTSRQGWGIQRYQEAPGRNIHRVRATCVNALVPDGSEHT